MNFTETESLTAKYEMLIHEKLSLLIRKQIVPSWLNQEIKRLAKLLGLPQHYEGDRENFLYSLDKVLRYTNTTEEDFQRILDENPEDHNTRMVFADWLQDRDDPRAEGYRALGRLKVMPLLFNDEHNRYGFTHTKNPWRVGEINRSAVDKNYLVGTKHGLPKDWLGLISELRGSAYHHAWEQRKTRKEIEDEAALAFSKLSPERQVEILEGH